MRRSLFFSTSYIPSDLSQAKEGATTHSLLVPVTPAVTDEQKLMLPKLQKKIHETDHAPSSSRPPFRSSKVVPVNSYLEVVGAIPLASDLVVIVSVLRLCLNFAGQP
jgi:hypothetical protein